MTVGNENSLYIKARNIKRRAESEQGWSFDPRELSDRADRILDIIGVVEDEGAGEYRVTRTRKFEVSTESGQSFNASLFKNYGGVHLDIELDGVETNMTLSMYILDNPWEDVQAAHEIILDIEAQMETERNQAG